MDATDGFSQNHTDVHRLNFGTLKLLDLVGDGVSHHHLCEEAELGFSALSSVHQLLQSCPTIGPTNRMTCHGNSTAATLNGTGVLFVIKRFTFLF